MNYIIFSLTVSVILNLFLFIHSAKLSSVVTFLCLRLTDEDLASIYTQGHMTIALFIFRKKYNGTLAAAKLSLGKVKRASEQGQVLGLGVETKPTAPPKGNANENKIEKK